MTKIRDEYAVDNNDDVVVVFCQDLIAQGKGAELHSKLRDAVAKASVAKRA